MHRFFSNGPGTVAVAEHLQLGSWSPHANREGNSTLGEGMEVAGANLVPGPAGFALFLLGASSKGSLPNWAAHYRDMTKALASGSAMQIVRVYKLGNDPMQTSERQAIILGQQSLSYLASLKLPNGKKIAVHESKYQEKFHPPHNYIYFVGTSKGDKKGNLSVTWWIRNRLNDAGTILMGTSHLSSDVGIPGNLLHTAKQTTPNDYALSRIECMPVPGDPGEGLAVSSFIFKQPTLFIGTPAYSHAVKVFADDYMVSTSSSSPGGILIWHQGKHHNVSVPALK